jgi:hypothetical protein
VARTAALILYRSALFRDLFAQLLSGWASSIRTEPLLERPTLVDLGPAPEVAVVLEAGDGDERAQLACDYLLAGAGRRRVTVYAVDLQRDEIVRYRRSEFRSMDAVREMTGASAR